MINHSHQKNPAVKAAGLTLFALGLLGFGAFWGLALEASKNMPAAWAAFDTYLLRITTFTLYQALLSTALSVGLAIVLARALSRHPQFFGRRFILALFAIPLALPALVAAVGLIALLGRAGVIAVPFNAAFDFKWPGIYGLDGILVAHIFFNLPLATRFFLGALETIPQNSWALSRNLGMNGFARWRLIEWPAIKNALAGVSVLVFVLCATSFTLVLILGGGPRATTLEVAIYQSLRFEFEPARALAFVTVQFLLGGIFAFLACRITPPQSARQSVVRRAFLPPALPFELLLNRILIASGTVFVCAPLLAILWRGLGADMLRLVTEPAVIAASITSFMLSFLAALLTLAMALALLSAAHRRQSSGGISRLQGLTRFLTENGVGLFLLVSPLVLGAGWFILLRSVIDPFTIAPLIVVIVNAALALPFAIRIVSPVWRDSAERHDFLAQSLGLTGLTRLRLIEFKTLRPQLATAMTFAMALSFGDLGAIALWGSDALQTLPWLLYSRLGAYRTDDAAGLALLLAILCGLLMLFGDWIGRHAQGSKNHD